VPMIDEWKHKTWSVHTVQCFSNLKRKETLTHATTWIKLENIMLSEISQSQKDRYYMSLLTRGI
jgi:hypothetical protein